MSDNCSACYNCFLDIADEIVAYNPQTQKYHFTLYHNGKSIECKCSCNTCLTIYTHYALDKLLNNKTGNSIKLTWGSRVYKNGGVVKKKEFDGVTLMRKDVTRILTELGYTSIKIFKCCNAIDCIHYTITFQPIPMSVDEAGVS